MLQAKIKFRLEFFNLGWFSIFFVSCHWFFMNEGYKAAEIGKKNLA